MKGGYCLILSLDSETAIGTRGRDFTLTPGKYVYCGSALNSLEDRVERHIRNFQGCQVRRFWHIDHLLPHSDCLVIVKAPASSSFECKIVSNLTKKGLKPIPGFGNSDCRSGCGGHLLLSRGTIASTTRLVKSTFSELGLLPEVQILKSLKSS